MSTTTVEIMKKSFLYILLTISSILWGISFILTKELFATEEHITVPIILTFRLLLATVVTIPALLLFRKLEPIGKGDLKWFLLLSLLEPFIYSICETSGIQLVSGSLAAITVATIPLFVPFGMAIAYKEGIRSITLVGILLSLIGLAVMLMSDSSNNLDATPIGLLWLAGAVLIAVFFTIVLVKLVGRYQPFTITAYQNLFGLLYFIPIMLIFDGESLPLLSYSPKMLTMLLMLGVLCSTIAYALYNVGIAQLGATAACVFNNSIPAFSLIAALIIGQETFSWNKPVGIIIVITGVVLVQLRKERHTPIPSPKNKPSKN